MADRSAAFCTAMTFEHSGRREKTRTHARSRTAVSTRAFRASAHFPGSFLCRAVFSRAVVCAPPEASELGGALEGGGGGISAPSAPTLPHARQSRSQGARAPSCPPKKLRHLARAAKVSCPRAHLESVPTRDAHAQAPQVGSSAPRAWRVRRWAPARARPAPIKKGPRADSAHVYAAQQRRPRVRARRGPRAAQAHPCWPHAE
jgi:hypothetical protein